jgi:hypothetical protein
MYKIIMVPTDGSGFDREAIRVALRVAELSKAEVRLVRVHSTGAFFGGCVSQALSGAPPLPYINSRFPCWAGRPHAPQLVGAIGSVLSFAGRDPKVVAGVSGGWRTG